MAGFSVLFAFYINRLAFGLSFIPRISQRRFSKALQHSTNPALPFGSPDTPTATMSQSQSAQGSADQKSYPVSVCKDFPAESGSFQTSIREPRKSHNQAKLNFEIQIENYETHALYFGYTTVISPTTEKKFTPNDKEWGYHTDVYPQPFLGDIDIHMACMHNKAV